MSFQNFQNSPASFFLGCQKCPACKETVFAAEAADVERNRIAYRWTCDLCGHQFTTEAEFASEAA